MTKYILMLGSLVGVTILGGAGILYSLIVSAPITVTRQNTPPQAFAAEEALAEAHSMTITIR